MYIQDESNVNNIYYNCTETSGNVVTRTTQLLDCQWKGMGSSNKIIPVLRTKQEYLDNYSECVNHVKDILYAC
jgi:hypothetical protein